MKHDSDKIIKERQEIAEGLQFYLDDSFINTPRGYTIDPQTLSDIIKCLKEGRPIKDVEDL